MKKIITLLLSALLMSALVLPVFAATPVNAYEKQIMDKLKAGVVVGDKTIALSAAELNTAENFFMMDGIEFTQADATAILNGIDQISAIIKAAGKTDLTLLTADQKNQILAIAQASALAVTSVPLTFNYDFATTMATIMSGTDTLVTSDVTTQSYVIKNTGFSAQTAMWVGLILVLGMASAVVLAKKNNLLDSKA